MEYVKEMPNNYFKQSGNNAVSILFEKLEKTCLDSKKSNTCQKNYKLKRKGPKKS